VTEFRRSAGIRFPFYYLPWWIQIIFAIPLEIVLMPFMVVFSSISIQGAIKELFVGMRDVYRIDKVYKIRSTPRDFYDI
jgi:hypothetical protein